MKHGICHLSVVPVRAEPADKAEMINQLLFGEQLLVTAKHRQWVKISSALDDYEGWIDEKQFLSVPEKYFTKINDRPAAFALDLVQSVSGDDEYFPVVIGSELHDFDGINFRLFQKKYTYSGQAVDATDSLQADKIVKVAKKYLHTPYLWGGRSPFGIDCSGFVQVVFKIAGIKLKRDAWQQMEKGRAISFLEEAKTGDLAFFDNEGGDIIHIGIILKDPENHSEKPQIIHAHGSVRIDILDHFGIYNRQTKKYSHKLRMIKRLI